MASVKILFRFHSDTLDETVVETLRASIVNGDKGHYRIDNIPFYVPGLACGDIVFAEFDDDEAALTYRETIRPSGNSTIQVIVMDQSKNVEDVREIFREMGCESEGKGNNYFVMEVPADMDYGPVKLKLELLLDKGILDYAEACLSENH